MSPDSTVIVAGGSLPGRHLDDQIVELVERRVERRPVLEVEGAAETLAQPGDRPAPRTLAQRFVPLLQSVQATGHVHGQRRGDEEVVARRGGTVR